MTTESTNQALLDELQEKFTAWKTKAQFTTSFDELNNICFIEDMVLSARFVSPQVNRMICARIRDTFISWINSFHNWLLPNPNSLIDNTEYQIFSEEERSEMKIMFKDFMTITSENIIHGLTKDSIAEGKYIDNCIKVWNTHLPKLIEISKKINKGWEIDDKDKDKMYS